MRSEVVLMNYVELSGGVREKCCLDENCSRKEKIRNAQRVALQKRRNEQMSSAKHRKSEETLGVAWHKRCYRGDTFYVATEMIRADWPRVSSVMKCFSKASLSVVERGGA